MHLKNKHFSSYFLFWNSYLDVIVCESNSIFCMDSLLYWRASQVVLVVKEPACQCGRHNRHEFNPWGGKIPWSRNGTHSSILAWKILKAEELVGYSQWSCRVRTEHSLS